MANSHQAGPAAFGRKSQVAQVGPTPFGDRGTETKFSKGAAREPGPSVHDTMHDAFAKAESKLNLTPAGNGRYGVPGVKSIPEPKTPQPAGGPIKPLRSLAQESAVKKAGAASGIKRSLRKGLPKL